MLRSLPRLLLLSGLVLVPLLLAAPWVTGRVAEQVYLETLSGLQEQPGIAVLGESHYRRSYGQSEAITKVSLAAREDRPAMTLTLSTEVQHRVTGVRSHTRVSADNGLFPQSEPQIELKAGLTGAVRGEFTLPVMHWPDCEQNGLTIQAAEGTLRWRPGRELVLSSNLASLAKDDPEVEGWALEDGQLRFNGSLRHEHLSAQLSLEAGSLQVQGSALGPQRLSGRIADFHAPSVAGIVSALQALVAQRDSLSLSAQAEEQRLAFNQLSAHLQRLSVHGGELTLKLDSGSESLGASGGQLRLTYPALPQPQSQLPVSLLQHAEGETRLRMDPAYVQALPNNLQTLLIHWQEKAWLLPLPEGLVASARLLEQKLVLEDGSEIRLPPLL